MKNIKHINLLFFMAILFLSCESDIRETSFLDIVPSPYNISAVYDITQDNSGLVTITPNAENAVSYEIDFGDGTPEMASVLQGQSVDHVYAEGSYEITIKASNVKGDVSEMKQQLIVSFIAPQNLVVVIENDASISKQVNVTANAEFATVFEFNSGEDNVTQPVVSGNIGETISYQYADAGTYSVVVTAKGGAIETTDFAVDFEVTEILEPLTAAPTPPGRSDADVVSIFSDAYTNVTLNELPTGWSALANFESFSLFGNTTWKLSGLDFLGMVTNYDSGVDVSQAEFMHIDYWVPEGTTNGLLVKIVNTVDGGEAEVSLGDTVGGSWQSIDIDMSEFNNGNLSNKEKITQILIDSQGVSGVVYIDNLYFYKTSAASTFDDGLLNNGDFEAGSESWIVGVDDNSPAPVVTNSGNTYYSVNVTNPNSSQPFLVNVSQKLEIVEGNSYTLTFDAWSDVNRSIIAGIGLSGGNFANDSRPVAITPSRQTYSLTLSSNGFGAADARVLFDLAGEAGMVNIDNVSLVIGTGNIVQNGNFENGSTPWIVGVDDNSPAPVVTNNGNSYYSVNVTNPNSSQPFLVNLSQKLEIVEGNTYTLRFDAWSDVNRSIIAGIGLSGGSFANDAKSVDIITTRQTYTLTLSSNGFGAADARVLFDLAGEAGMVNIDNVSLSRN